jgi:endothelial cell adhesion protein
MTLYVIFIFSDDEEIHHIEIQRSGGGFGFSIRGGAEYNSQLCVLRIADGGAAERDGRLRVRERGREGERERGRERERGGRCSKLLHIGIR